MKDKLTRQKEAQERKDVHNKLTTKQKLLKLDMRYGQGNGATKERARLFLKLVKEEHENGNVSTGRIPPKQEKKSYQKPKRS